MKITEIIITAFWVGFLPTAILSHIRLADRISELRDRVTSMRKEIETLRELIRLHKTK